ncbi:hypothetical protein [Bacillus sp. Marseille-P3661]|uniref:hypothetical protein n=1 Tax=Bacillus sp. Marseille-P3661 TaxID=1936234 RepID=UPI000C85ABA4|nr:hypothetical protein [Bacillus sp. Marseille-P3661]
MKQLEQFRQAAEKISTRINELEQEKQAKLKEVSENQRLIADLRVTQAMDEDRADEIEKEIAKLKRPIEKIEQTINDINERIQALETARGKKLEEIRDDAYKAMQKELNNRQQEINAKFADLKELRALIVGKLLEIAKTKQEYTSLVHEFKYLSNMVDGTFSSDSILKLTLPEPRSFYSNNDGNHKPILPLESECYQAYMGIAPDWFVEWQLSGEIVSSAEVRNRAAKRGSK